MLVEEITTLEDFEGVREEWERIYKTDPYANVFLSWPFMNAYYRTHSDWLILAVRASSVGKYDAFVPLHYRSHALGKELCLGAAPTVDYCGLLWDPVRSERALVKLAPVIADLKWDVFSATGIVDERLESLFTNFAQSEFALRRRACVPCPYLMLPDSWKKYLAEFPSKAFRHKLLAAMNAAESAEGFRFKLSSDEDADATIDALLRFKSARHQSALQHLQGLYGPLLRAAHRSGALMLASIWSGQMPMGVQAIFIDPVHRAFSSYMSGFDPAFTAQSPGIVLRGFTIRHGIAMGYRRYDMLMGAEPYKYKFGARSRYIADVTIARRGARSQALLITQLAHRAAVRLRAVASL